MLEYMAKVKMFFAFTQTLLYHKFVPQEQHLFGSPLTPGEALKDKLAERGWTQDELALIMGISRVSVANLIAGRSGITPEMASLLAAAFGNEAAFWMKLDAEYRLSRVRTDVSPVEQRSRLFQIAPVRQMIKRGWIRPSANPVELQAELEQFFGQDAFEEGISFPVATRRTVKLPNLNPSEIAWCFRARHLASTLMCNAYSTAQLETSQKALRRLASHPKEAHRLPKLLADCGIRFVVIEPLPDARIDGAAFWDDRGPVIAVSIRHDRIDGFWFTVMHECAHIRNGDPLSVDTGLIDGVKGITVTLAEDATEARANTEAAASLVPTEELESFIRRVGPLYSRERVIQFANRIKIHPGIIVGQLQYRRELGYMALREFLVKIREAVISTALTDGWGQSIAPTST
jgi:HTH-type transcriptional regulator/antitoxin HigA